MKNPNRRIFLKSSALAALPAFISTQGFSKTEQEEAGKKPAMPSIKFSGDGRSFEPLEYLEELKNVNVTSPLTSDFYGKGGAVEALEKRFAELTGKESAIFMPTGTMANQFAIAVLSREKTKVYVQDTSHLYRDEADAAQSVFNKRLMPLAKGETYFTALQLKDAIEELPSTEVFQSGVGAISIENPVRRSFGATVPLEEIKKICSYCKANSIGTHLDGARIFLASAWTGVSVKEYSSFFDTVYVSLYKYLGASAGAILCGDKSVIDKMPNLIKIHGGNMHGSWSNAAMALHRLEGIEKRYADMVVRADELIAGINKIQGVRITGVKEGTNIYKLALAKSIDSNKMRDTLSTEFGITVRPQNDANEVFLMMNETILYQTAAYILNAFAKSI